MKPTFVAKSLENRPRGTTSERFVITTVPRKPSTPHLIFVGMVGTAAWVVVKFGPRDPPGTSFGAMMEAVSVTEENIMAPGRYKGCRGGGNIGGLFQVRVNYFKSI